MAMDGSFRLESALKRFLARCPKLKNVKKIDDLIQKGHMLKEEEAVNLLSELFVNPEYTIPLVGCFRPIAQKIVDKVVGLLCHCNLNCNPNDTVADQGYCVDEDVVYVIEHYDQSGRGLILHELACLAFCRALDLNHSLLGSVSVYFKFAPPPFERILREGAVFDLSKVAISYLFIARISYRFLLLEPECFSKQWDWSCFLDLVENFENLDQGLSNEYGNQGADLRWCGIQILSIILKLSGRAVENFGVGDEESALCLLRWEEFCGDVAVEKVSLYVEPYDHTKLGSHKGGIDSSQQQCIKSLDSDSLTLSHLHGTQLAIKSRRLVKGDYKSAGNVFVMTSALEKSFEMVLLAVNQKWPVLLYGPASSGKTALISRLALDAGNQVMSIHMDEQIDGKTLIGGYVCTELPGEFRWQHGTLIQAVLSGYWVVFEDIDKAPSDVQSIILPLLEGANSFMTSHGEEIRVSDSFRLFSTISTSKNDISHNAEGGKLLSNLWRRVMTGLPDNDDMQNIVKAWYPDLEPLAGKLIETLDRVNTILHHSVGFQSVSRFSLRDLLKWCKRIAGLGFIAREDALTAYHCQCIYQEAIDIFAAFSMFAENRLTIMKEIAKLWAAPFSDGSILHPYKPEVQVLLTELRIGRITLQRTETALHGQDKLVKMRSSLHALERIACSVKCNEPVLLVGETGTGKTTLVQNLSMMLGQRLTVLNLSQQSDIADLLGGFKPADPQSICIPLYKEFESLFSKAFSVKENDKLFAYLQKQLSKKNWKTLLNGFRKYFDTIRHKVQERSGFAKKRKKPLDGEEKLREWENFSVKLENAYLQIGDSSGMVFSFVEGAFVTALRSGEWILLDEVNLAPPETLQRLIGVLEGENGSLCLTERGDINYVPRHPSFRIFACMNPATDAGKRDLPYSLRSRFSEYFVDDALDKEDLKLFVNKYMEESQSNKELEKNIIDFYEAAKKISEERLQDGANQKPQYSLRSLYRALQYTREAKGKFGFQKAMYDGFCMFFLTLLDRPSAKIMKKMINDKLIGGVKPSPVPFDAYLKVKKDSSSDDFLESYVLTRSVNKQLENLARAVFIKKYPVLLQGPTSSGKTSLVQYLAVRTGHKFVRINNHEHTDLQEYLGSYISDASGKLIFHEGALVKAVRNGYWIVLDELNLAPSDVLEALNRLLDDNRELFVPELRETIQAHPNFMLFATQNPPTFYGGRKMLSRAFRNRFVEVHVDEIPDHELSTIIEKRCKIPGSRAKLMVQVMKELQLHRQHSKVFAGKHGFITPRDLFRWANRLRTFGDSKEVMAKHGYYLLADRLRDEGERHVVKEVLEKHLRVKVVKDDLYKESFERDAEDYGNVIWTRSMRKLYFLVKRCYELREPVLLVGETGGGKTTVCQLLSSKLGSKLHILNCHQYTETSDFLGGFYPNRDRSRLLSEFKCTVGKLLQLKAYIHFPENLEISSDIGQLTLTLNHLDLIVKSYIQGQVSSTDITLQDLDALEQVKLDLTELHQKWQTIFMWQDGPLVQAMKAGDLFLVDEISLADDSVLERLNSVLEPERKLALAEKGGSLMEEVSAHENFFMLATMNPGGDYGKKELSPALRNRFTEIWVPAVSDLDELRCIALKRLSSPELTHIVDAMLNFWDWYNQLQTGRILTVRDLLSWIKFINATKGSVGPNYAILHGLFLVLLDGLSLGTGLSRIDAGVLRMKCLSFLVEQLKLDENEQHKLSFIENYGWGDLGTTSDIFCSDDMQCHNIFGVHPFYIEKGYELIEAKGFEFSAPTTRRNALRVLRAMQLSNPVLLEGSPGVGKTSLIVALGKYSGHKVVRINLSEQTDLMDLLGSDLPVESDEGVKFSWSDGILLQALKEGCWVLLDELNLAPQSVLEGLNSILDHRADVFIPELGLTFKCPSSFRVFACQNPFSQGGGRKGLPKSFLNRFTKVYVDELVEDDYLLVCSSLYPSIPRPVLSKLIVFNKKLHEDIVLHHKFAQDGSPWEFNLRDVIRSCQMIQGASEKLMVSSFLNVLFVQRMRTAADRREVMRICEEVFKVKPSINPYPQVQLNSHYLIVGDTSIKRNNLQSFKLSNSQLNIMPGIRHSLEAVVHCIKHQWLCILVGPPSSGKTSLIRLLSQLTGNVLNELNLSSTTDISELLGCFEQYNAFRNLRLIVAQVELYVNEYCSLQMEFSKGKFIRERKDLIVKWLAFLSSIKSTFLLTATSTYLENLESIVQSLGLLVEIIEQLKLDEDIFLKNGLHVSWSSTNLTRIIKVISKLQEDRRRRVFSPKFEWVSGLLVKAIENGEWIVLENANLCNPTVLDRINSLVEQSGSILVNECGIVDGSPLILHPHPNFRLFLTMNPSYGEISRAMRNRGVEIFMMQPYWLLEKGSGCSSAELELKDVKRFLILSGVPVGKLVDMMAQAHIYARNEGLRLNAQITYLELTRWVQLFQQLLINGNQPLWSLQISWEHTYVSSLGEATGCNIVDHAKLAYLEKTTLSEYDRTAELSLCSYGGWPMPLKLWDFIMYSKEVSVKQNFIYLEYLVAQYESRRSWNGDCMDHDLSSTGQVAFYKNEDGGEKVAKKMIMFAANWTIEQATESNYKLYLLKFWWLSSKLQHLAHFFHSFQSLLKQEFEHPIWKFIFQYHNELASLLHVDPNLMPIPLLSLSLVDFTESDKMPKLSRKLLSNAINCVGLLRLSYQQWSAESGHQYSNEARCFKPVLECLQELEKEILNMLVQSPSYDVLIERYSNLLEDHIVLWDALNSSKSEQLLISWHSLVKDVEKLRNFCPRAAENILVIRSKNLDKVFHQFSQQSLLWIHGGHPILPASAELFHKQKQFLELCELVWPTKRNAFRQVNDWFLGAVARSNPELRLFAAEGISLSLCTNNLEEDNAQVIQQLEDMYQLLLEKFGCEKLKLEAKLQFNDHAVLEGDLVCCLVDPEILCIKSAFVSLQGTLPIVDSTSFVLDMELLQNLSLIVLLDPSGFQLALGGVCKLLHYAWKYSLTSSTRPPQYFTPHQKILWILKEWESVDGGNAKIISYVLEMWFWWHTYLWSYSPDCVENFSKVDGYDVPLPHMLLQPVKTASVIQILQHTCPIKDYTVHTLKLRVASCNLWQSHPYGTNLSSFLLTVARSLFQQIIFAHKKAFDGDKFDTLRSIFSSFEKNKITQDDIQHLCSLIVSSSHQRLNSSVGIFIEPMLSGLYLHGSPTDFLNVGCAWLHIGGLRFSLLLSFDDLDPAMKYSHKYLQVEEKISSLKLELKVRQECEYLAGWSYSREVDKKRAELLDKLEVERKRLRRKMVFRCNPIKFTALRKECKEFLKHVTAAIDLVSNVEAMELQQVIDQVCNWQETSSCFIDQLSDEYKEYIDIAQPVQVAVYEMKLGMSLVLYNTLQKKFLNRIEEDNMTQVMESICSFMKFPRGYFSGSISSHGAVLPTNLWELEINLLEKLVSVSSDVHTVKLASVLQLKTAFHQNILARITRFVANARRIDKSSFMILDKIFSELSGMWMSMKVQLKNKETNDAQQYKFRPRAFEIKSVIDVDISTLGKLFANDSFLEWQDMLSEEEHQGQMEAGEEGKSLEEEWNLVQEPILSDMISMHNKLFGSTDLVIDPGTFPISDDDRLRSFVNSYTFGAGIIEGLGGLVSASLDTELAPEHLLRLCLEHEKMIFSSTNYNYYKDSNAPVMAKMVKLLITLQQRIHSLLSEWEDHPRLQKIMDVVEMLLTIPMNTPLAKALSGLQFLINRIRSLQEEGSKFPLSAQLEPIVALVFSWQKMEFDSWPALLDEVQAQYEVNAAKLWFPLFSVLHHGHTGDIAGYEQSTLESLEEFIQTSSIGEFRRRLQLVFAFHGQISTGRLLELESYTSAWQESNLKGLYNVFGYYVQFLPSILEHIEANRRNIEMELKELLKLCHWERTEAFLSFENSKRTRQKLRKLIQKYNDLLQQPAMLILNQGLEHKGAMIQSIPRNLNLDGVSEKNVGMLNAVLDLAESRQKERYSQFDVWRKQLNDTMQNLDLDRKSELSFLDKDVAIIVRQCLASQSASSLHQERWNSVWQTLEMICKTTMHCNDLWVDTKKSIGKRRALSELLKLLESSGLHKHKFDIIKVSNNSNWLFVQPSYDAEHLLPTNSRVSSGASDVNTAVDLQCLESESLDTEWKTANKFYFKSIASVQLLQQICLKPHEDISYEQASRAVSFLNHLIVIQQSQRNAAYCFAKHLKCLRECERVLGDLYAKSGADDRSSRECFIARNQRANFKCMWAQKHLFDDLSSMLVDESLLLRTVESSHLKSCETVKPAVNHVVQFIQKFIPIIQKSQESLNNYLLGHAGAMQNLSQESLDKHLFHHVGVVSAGPFRPYVITKHMEHLVHKNLLIIKEFEENLLAFRRQDSNRSLVMESMLGRFDDALQKGKLLSEQLEPAFEALNEATEESCSENNSMLETDFVGTLKNTFELVLNLLKERCPVNNVSAFNEESVGNITSWECLFQSSVTNLNVEAVYDNLLTMILSVEKTVNQSSREISHLSFQIGACFEHLHALLELLLSLSDGLLKDLLVMNKAVSVMTHVLANVLASLFSKGFGIPAEDQLDDASHDKSQNASGTGMGEGSGLNDVSDQITDEDQLLGTSEKPDEEQDTLGEIPNKNDKGIEMEQDFAADTFSVSEDSGEEENDEDSEDEKLESAMGEAGADSQVVDEKLWNKKEDENPNNSKEKYEQGPSIRDTDVSDRELRAKEDSAAVADEEPGEIAPDGLNEQNDEIGDEDHNGDKEENLEDMDMDKEEAFADPTGLKLDESTQGTDDSMEVDEDVNENEGLESKEEINLEGAEESVEDGSFEEENSNPPGETMEETAAAQDGETEKNEAGEDNEQKSDMNSMGQRKEVVGPGISDHMDLLPNLESAIQPNGDPRASNSGNVAPDANVSNANESLDGLAPLRNLPSGNTSEMDVMVSHPSNSGKFIDDPQYTQLPRGESSTIQNTQPNPFRNVGDALERWKERVRVSIDLQAPNTEAPADEIQEEDADEYGYASKFDKGTAQTLGPATSEQIDVNVNDNKTNDDDSLLAQRDDIANMEIEKQSSEEWHNKHFASVVKNKIEEQEVVSDVENSPEETPEVRNYDYDDQGSRTNSLVSIKMSYLRDNINQLSELSVDDNELGKVQDPEEVSLDVKNNAATLWRRYELTTTRLSQELAEQLRLVMEPTLASKLQGDYKTGKRINMKKVIPYIASHYRKDKIWLRRTRPNKRDYQVVIAVDDSQSMSESGCGGVAVESLVTVCRAMSQLEVGNLAVASFGKKGNIRLLHDFEQPFTGEAGVKIISSLTFMQENTIADEPVVDLLMYLNKMLDAAVAKARLPSGQNPLQQLVLIIADGRFHEKEKLKRCVRNFLSQKRMVAFLLVDNPQESMLDQMEASFVGKGDKKTLKFTKYLDSFPFPYYVLLRKIEELPRTLADLLRQWFELMQYSRD